MVPEGPWNVCGKVKMDSWLGENQLAKHIWKATLRKGRSHIFWNRWQRKSDARTQSFGRLIGHEGFPPKTDREADPKRIRLPVCLSMCAGSVTDLINFLLVITPVFTPVISSANSSANSLVVSSGFLVRALSGVYLGLMVFDLGFRICLFPFVASVALEGDAAQGDGAVAVVDQIAADGGQGAGECFSFLRVVKGQDAGFIGGLSQVMAL